MKSRPGQEEPPEGARRTPFLQPLPSSREVILQFGSWWPKEDGERKKAGVPVPFRGRPGTAQAGGRHSPRPHDTPTWMAVHQSEGLRQHRIQPGVLSLTDLVRKRPPAGEQRALGLQG